MVPAFNCHSGEVWFDIAILVLRLITPHQEVPTWSDMDMFLANNMLSFNDNRA